SLGSCSTTPMIARLGPRGTACATCSTRGCEVNKYAAALGTFYSAGPAIRGGGSLPSAPAARKADILGPILLLAHPMLPRWQRGIAMAWRIRVRSRRWLGLGGVAVALGLVAIVVAWPSVIRRVAIARIEAITHRTVEIQAVHLNPFTGRHAVQS